MNIHTRTSKVKIVVSYVLLYLIIALTSIPFFVGNEYLIIFFIISAFIFIVKKNKIDKFIFYYCLVYFAIFLVQSFFFSVLEESIILGYLLRILYAYFTIKLIGKDIAKYFVNIICFFTIISFFLFFPTLFFPDLIHSSLENISELIKPFQVNEPGRSHIIIYTYGLEYSDAEGIISASVPRNSGPFWEPGGFGVFLILAMIFELIEKKNIFTKKNLIIFIGVLTTLSTGTFVALFVLIVFYLITYRSLGRILLLMVFVVLSFLVYINTFFLQEKVITDLASSNSVSLANAPRTRFVSAQLDLIDFFNNPILGRGRFEATRFDVKESKTDRILTHRNNGTTNMLVEFGIFGFLAFFVTMRKSFKAYCLANNFKTNFAVFAVLIVIMLGFYEMILIKPFFIGLSFMFLAAGYKTNAV